MGGEVTVAGVPSVVRSFLPQVLREFHECYLRIVIGVTDEGASEVLSSVVCNEADLGLNNIGVQQASIECQPGLREPLLPEGSHSRVGNNRRPPGPFQPSLMKSTNALNGDGTYRRPG
ncbi:LysR substrate-binding domain-containing protein [Pseudomonas bohemica]|uniref:LysR substrate-binding domain-containing protein n=1 Tax=Pseudomonas bohemica TaxID=2044872 RepID=UPI0018FEB5D2|nr:LysR substrate-binding domain-containing protein [Pseudomonas bohemica]